jgi:hypothetical protein
MASLMGVLLLSTDRAVAHAWGNTYSLPIPFAMYAYGASAALIISFVLVFYFAKADVATSTDVRMPYDAGAPLASAVPASKWLSVLKLLSVSGFVLTVLTGLLGNPSPFANFSMTYFWVIFVLGFAYFTALTGDLYSLISPWKVLCEWAGEIWPNAFVARKPYPTWAGYWPAIILYGAFLWIELFGQAGPRFLAIALIAYTSITLLGASIFGKQKWFQYGEFFGVFLQLISMLAPFERIVVHGDAKLRLRQPFEALTRATADHPSLTLFILFMLCSTAFDGAHETLPWVNIFWRQIFPRLEPLISSLGLKPYDVASNLYYGWQWIMLALSPFLYYGVYWLFIWMTKLVTGSALTVGQLALRFALSLIPIAFVYHVSHYFALLLIEGPNIVARASDPFGFGWDLFGTGAKDLSIVASAGVVWHTQVWLILVGHIVAVYVAHVQALQVFPGRAQALRSQLPMLFLMVLLTSLGLWILSLPIAAGQVSSPSAIMG